MLRIADKVFDSHLFTGTGKFASPQLMVDAIRESGSQLVTLAMKRVDLRQHNDAIRPLAVARSDRNPESGRDAGAAGIHRSALLWCRSRAV